MVETIIRGGQYNIGHICTRQQCDDGHGSKIALRWLTPSLERCDYSFNDLEQQSSSFANCLANLGFSAGDIFFTFLPKAPEQFFSFLGALKLKLITGTLFSNFGDEALLDRLKDARAKGVITKKSLLKKITQIRDQLPDLKTIILTDITEHLATDILSYKVLMDNSTSTFIAEPTSFDTPSVLHYTSGSTGKPKGVLHQHGSILSQSDTSRLVLDLDLNDIFWCTADQGWVTGTSYGIIGPWSLGITQVHFGGAYDAESWFEILEKERVTVWYTAPTALRMLMREEPYLFSNYCLAELRHIFSVGEPLNPEVVHWARQTLGKEVYDTWFQTETGSIMIANRPGLEVKPGSMGKPVGGIEAVIVDENGSKVAGVEQGNLCLKPDWPSMFVAYLNNELVFQEKFRHGLYYTGDTACQDGDGYFWFKGRSDDIINTAGHLISPFEVESGLLEIEEISESGVIGVPDEILFEKVVAFISLHEGYTWTKELELKIRLHVTNKVSSIATPQEILVIESIPKNKSGKIMRRVLKARYLGADLGDISTLEI